jgi:hypothetical protein
MYMSAYVHSDNYYKIRTKNEINFVVVYTFAEGLGDINTQILATRKCQETAIHHHGVHYFAIDAFNYSLIQHTCFYPGA